MADGYDRPYVGGAAGFFHGALPGLRQAGIDLATIPLIREQERRFEEERSARGLNLLADALKLPRSMRGPYIDHLTRTLGINPTLGQMLKRADDEQAADVVTMLTQAGVENPAEVGRALQYDLGTTVKLYTESLERKRVEAKQRQLEQYLTSAPGGGRGAEAPPPGAPAGRPPTLGPLREEPEPLAFLRPQAPPGGAPAAGPMLGPAEPAAGAPEAPGTPPAALQARLERHRQERARLQWIIDNAPAGMREQGAFKEYVTQKRETLEKEWPMLKDEIDRATPDAGTPTEEWDPVRQENMLVTRTKDGRTILWKAPAPQKFQSTAGQEAGDLAAAIQKFGPDSPQARDIRARQEQARVRADLELDEKRANIAKLKAEAAGAGGPKFEHVASMARAYNDQAKPFQHAQQSYRDLQQFRNAKDAAGQSALITSFAKLQLPGEAVMEGDIRRVAQLPGLSGQVYTAINQLLNNNLLTDTQVRDIVAAADKLWEAKLAGQRQLEEQYTALAEEHKFPPHLVFRSSLPPPGPTTRPTGGGVPLSDIRTPAQQTEATAAQQGMRDAANAAAAATRARTKAEEDALAELRRRGKLRR